MNNKVKKPKKTKNPNAVIYFFIFILVYPLLRILFKLELKHDGYSSPEGPCVVICNHQSYLDFLLVISSMYPRRLNGVTAQKFFFVRPLNKFLPFMGAIPKSLFEPDMQSIVAILDVAKRGNSLLLFPEGRITTDGTFAGVHRSTGKLLKKLGIPVVSCTLEGSYICMPFWRKGFRRGKLRVTLSNLLSMEDAKALTVDEINARIGEDFSKADTSPSNKQFYVFGKKRLIEGLEKTLYLCPCCSLEFTLATKGNLIWCEVCGSAAEMDRYARLAPADKKEVFASSSIVETEKVKQNGDKPTGVMPQSVQEWYKLQVAHEMKALSEDMEPIIIPVTVNVSTAKAGGFVSRDRGVLKLDSRGWHYDGKLCGEDVSEFYPIETVPALPFDPCENFQIYAKGRYHAYTPEDNPQACVKFSVLGECAYHRFAGEVQMTKPLFELRVES